MSDVSLAEFEGPLKELREQCSAADGRGRQRFEEFKLWLKGVTAGLLKFVQKVAVSATPRFVAKDVFTKANPKVKFWGFGDNFTKHFLGKIEEGVLAGQIAVHTLLKRSLNPEIMTELGTQQRIMKLAHFYQLIEAQGQGQVGPLLINGYANIAYIEDEHGNVWAVRAYWYAEYGWYVVASSVEGPYGWLVGDQVLSQAT